MQQNKAQNKKATAMTTLESEKPEWMFDSKLGDEGSENNEYCWKLF
jgi:hypothetical protein